MKISEIAISKYMHRFRIYFFDLKYKMRFESIAKKPDKNETMYNEKNKMLHDCLSNVLISNF